MTINSQDETNDQSQAGGKHVFEIIEFSLERHLNEKETLKGIYGINVAKVREVVKLPKINKLASSAVGVEGVFELRKVPIPAINLCQILGDLRSPITSSHQIIVTEFSGKRAGFIVNSTHRIRRIPWDKVLPPSTDANSCISGMVLLEDNQFLLILDLEKIIEDIENGGNSLTNIPSSNLVPNPVQVSTGDDDSPHILLAEDSAIMRNNISKYLQEAGFNVIVASDGIMALEFLKKPENLKEIKAIVTDLEMPRMDGYTFLDQLEANSQLKNIPVVIHSSLNEKVIQKSNQNKNKHPYVEKNDLEKLVSTLNSIIGQ